MSTLDWSCGSYIAHLFGVPRFCRTVNFEKLQQVEESHLGVFNISAIEIVRFTIRAASPLLLDSIAYKFDEYAANPRKVLRVFTDIGLGTT